jgi:hypothetical protein
MLDPFQGWKQYKEKKMMRPKPIFYVLLFGVFFWLCIFYYGFFHTVMTTVIMSAIFGLWLRLTGRS